MSLHTLREMAKGGIYDQLGGGFARYSTDENWHIPHFEKMLYDNAQLAVNYLEAYQITREESFKQVARRDSRLYSARYDQSTRAGFTRRGGRRQSCLPQMPKEKKEGAFYVWDRAELISIAGDKAGEIFAFRYGVREGGNAAHDPHGEFTNKNILYVAHSIPETAKRFDMSESDTATLHR